MSSSSLYMPSPSPPTPSLVTRIFFPTRLLHEIQGGYMIGWNINDFTACIMCLIRPEEYSYQELTEVLEQILYNNVTTNLREYCGGSPVVIGYLEPQKFTKIPNLEIQKQTNSIWITMSMELSAALEIDGKLHAAPLLKSIYCCGCRHATSTQIVLFDDVDSNQLHYLSRNHSGFMKQKRNPSMLIRRRSSSLSGHNNDNKKNEDNNSGGTNTKDNKHDEKENKDSKKRRKNTKSIGISKNDDAKQLSELDFALHQINSMQSYKNMMYKSLRLKKRNKIQSKTQSNEYHKNDDMANNKERSSCCHRIIIKPFVAIYILFLLFFEFAITILSTRLPSTLPYFGGKSLRESSVLAHVLDLRLRTICHLPFLFHSASTKKTKYLNIELRNELHFKAFSEIFAIGIDILVGLVIGFILFQFSKRSDFVLELLHYGGHVLHMDVLTDSTKWLMGVPAGMKLNTALTEWIGTIVLAVLDLWNLVTTQVAALEPTIVLLIGACGVMGISIVLAVLVDMVHCFTVHILLIYSVFASVHAFMLSVINSLWHLFRGRKRNILRNRVDTLDFSMEQLLLGTILFTILVFLFPTFAVYYVFFLTVWMTILLSQAVIWLLLTIMTTVPFYAIYIHTRGNPSSQCLPGAIRLSLCQPIIQSPKTPHLQNANTPTDSVVPTEKEAHDYTYTPTGNVLTFNSAFFTPQNNANNHNNEVINRYADVTHLRLKGVPVRFSVLLEKFFSYISAWYKHYHPVRIIRSSFAGKFIRPLPFLLRGNDVILSEDLPSKEMLYRYLK